jgi:hypothetical protein
MRLHGRTEGIPVRIEKWGRNAAGSRQIMPGAAPILRRQILTGAFDETQTGLVSTAVKKS